MRRTPLRRISAKRLAQLGYMPRTTVTTCAKRLTARAEEGVAKLGQAGFRFMRKKPRLAVERVEDQFHPRGYREVCSPAEMRRRKLEFIEKQSGLCALCERPLSPDPRLVQLDHKKTMPAGCRKDDHRENLHAVHPICNYDKGSKSMEQIENEIERKAEPSQDRKGLRDRLRESWRSRVCPVDQKLKQEGHTFCADCYFLLPPQMQRDLYKLLGRGYEEAVKNATQFLESRRGKPKA